MTEAEWLACESPTQLLTFLDLEGQTNSRKLRLLACAACRNVWPLLIDERSRIAVEVAECYAEGEHSEAERERAQAGASAAFQAAITPACRDANAPRTAACAAARAALQTLLTDAHEAMARTLSQTANAARREPGADFMAAFARALLSQTVLIREIFGNPFRPITFDPAWRTSDAVLLARGIYAERAFDRMPILADALQDAGCDSEDVLNHCRHANKVHVRGCWVVDLVLEKE